MRLITFCNGFLAICLALAAGSASSEVTNGDFELGSTGWLSNAPSDWTISFPNSGGFPGGCAAITTGPSGGSGRISQTFTCTGPACAVTFNYRYDYRETCNPFPGLAYYFFTIDDGFWYSPCYSAEPGWGFIGEYRINCGVPHTIQIGVQAQPGALRTLYIDNVHCIDTTVDTDDKTWSGIKKLYRD